MLHSAFHSLIVLLERNHRFMIPFRVSAVLSCTTARNVLLSSVNSDKYPLTTVWCYLLHSLFTNWLASVTTCIWLVPRLRIWAIQLSPPLPPSYAFMACTGIALLTSPSFCILWFMMAHFIVSCSNILILFCGRLGVVNLDECNVLVIHMKMSVLSYTIPWHLLITWSFVDSVVFLLYLGQIMLLLRSSLYWGVLFLVVLKQTSKEQFHCYSVLS